MKTINLYEIKRVDGGVTITPIPQENIEPSKIRLVADEGMVLTNGELTTTVIDVDSAEEWTEIEAPIDWESLEGLKESDYIEVLVELGVLTNEQN